MSREYNVQCLCGHVFIANPGSALEQKCIGRERAGYIDALIVNGEGCAVCGYRQARAEAACADDDAAMQYMFDDGHPNAVERWLRGEELG